MCDAVSDLHGNAVFDFAFNAMIDAAFNADRALLVRNGTHKSQELAS